MNTPQPYSTIALDEAMMRMAEGARVLKPTLEERVIEDDRPFFSIFNEAVQAGFPKARD